MAEQGLGADRVRMATHHHPVLDGVLERAFAQGRERFAKELASREAVQEIGVQEKALALG